LDHLSALVDKSLVLVDAGSRPRYRLLETSRAYAMERLAEVGETDAWLRRHAEATNALCVKAVRLRDSEGIWAEANNIRTAYEWATRNNGDDAIAVSLACMPAMVFSVRGLVQEALQRLLQVEPLVGTGVPKALAARYWQWLGRIGIEGRLPTSRCIEALRRAEDMFRELGNARHVHACLRMRAEALVTQDDFDGAAVALRAAEDLESPGWPVADRLRRLRVHGLLHAAAGRHEASLASMNAAWEMACAAGVERYQLILLADMANVHLKMGQSATAAQQFRSLADKVQHKPSQGLTLAHALAGWTAALLSQPQIVEATTVGIRAVLPLRRSGLLVAYCDLYAWLMACNGMFQTSAQLIGAADEFHRYSETSRNAMKVRARTETLQALRSTCAEVSIESWMSAGAAASEKDIACMLDRAVQDLHADGVVRPAPTVTGNP
jgi:ATP/maltotriose-dependent transcriptional regulator MalT